MYPSSSFARWRQRTYLFGMTALTVLLAGGLASKAISLRSPIYRATAVVNGREAAATAETSSEAVRIANRAAEHLVGPVDRESDKRSRQRLAQARSETAQAREDLAAVQQSMSGLIAESPILPNELLRPQPANPPPPLDNLPAGPLPSPAWEELHRQLNALEANREELLQHMTDAHPTVQHIDEEIAVLTARLIAMPRTITRTGTDQHAVPDLTQPGSTNQEQSVEPAVLAPVADPPALELFRRQQDRFAQALTSQMQRLGDAESRLVECLVAERQAAEEFQRVSAVSRRQVLPARNAQRVAVAAPRWLGSLTIVLALTAGVAMAWIGGRQMAAFSTWREAERWLPIPVVGLVGGSSHTRPGLPRFIVQIIRRTCEATLAAALSASVLLSLSDFRNDGGITQQALRCGWETLDWLTSVNKPTR